MVKAYGEKHLLFHTANVDGDFLKYWGGCRNT